MSLLEGRTKSFEPAPASGYAVRQLDDRDIGELGALYYDSYDPGEADDTVESATEDIEASLAGRYGDLWPEASLVIEKDGRIVSAIMTVRRAPWEDAGDCPFIIELFTDREHRRQGLARLLVRQAMSVAAAAGHDRLQLRVAEDNAAAAALYRSLGFLVVP